MIGKRWWLALGLMAAVGCGDVGETKPAALDGPSSPTTGASAVPPTDASKGEAPASTGGMSPTGPADVPNRDAEGAKSKPEGAKSAAAATLSDEDIAEIKKLPAADQAGALAQKVCPISHDNLGGMGPPIKVEADGKVAYLCCAGCKKAFEKDPKAALAAIGK